MQRVVITGIGIYSCLGTSLDEVRDSLYNGKSGIILDTERKEFGFRSGLTGFVDRPNLKGLLARRQRIQLAEEGEYAYMATIQALEMSKMDNEFMEQNETGLIYGNDSSAKAVIESVDTIRAKKDTTLLGSGAIFQAMNSTVTMNLSTIFKVTGINFTVSAACASGSHSIGLAYVLIKNGLQERIICGGAQELNKYAMGSFDGLSAFSIQEADPSKASRPFDRDRDGLVPSGGAATVILESYESAIKRGAPILAEVVGYGFSSNGAHISKPKGNGAYLAMQLALQKSALPTSAIDYINAHGTATPINDLSEGRAIKKLFQNIPLFSSTKPYTGHTLAAAGAIEAVVSVLNLQHQFIAPNLNFNTPISPLNISPIKSLEKTIRLKNILSNSLGFGGNCSSLVFSAV
ncbi:UNVERIFIED_CONTAM: hypothetical protein GTU68_029056 [Idotea baltica]|nr:hypothetical protein [Idotea baltica]